MKKTSTVFIVVFLLTGIQKTFSQSSVLAAGDWFKLAVAREGIYCLTFNDLVSLGINPTSIDPRNISIYGNPAGMLSIANNVPHADDLHELAISVKGESDGVFDQGDSIFFYGQSPVQILKKAGMPAFEHKINIYSDSTCYFLTIGSVQGKRIQPLVSLPSFTNSISSYTDFEWHEVDSVNFLHSGKNWYGEMLSGLPQSSHSFSFDASQLINGSVFNIDGQVAGRSFVNGSVFSIFSNGVTSNCPISQVGSTLQDNFVYPATVHLTVPIGPSINGNIQFSYQSVDTGFAWLDYFDINFTRNLFLFRPQQVFSDINSSAPGNITHYMMRNVNALTKIWDVSDPLNVMDQQFADSSGVTLFNASNDTLHRYIAFDGNLFLTPRLIGQIPNQNLHSISSAQLIIVTAPQFVSEATILANFHQSHDNLQSIVVTVDQLYNEYSTGIQDPVGIRDFIRQVYKRSSVTGDSLKYVLLFGEGSYDFRGRLGAVSSVVPTYQSDGSINRTQTYDDDGFYSYVSDSATGIRDIMLVGVGRIPVRNSADAQVINKIMNYSSPASIGSWRKLITMVADDEDNNTHLRQTDTIANRLENQLCEITLRKIYLDAYVQNTVSGIQDYPEARADIDSSFKNGSLVIAYVGHGSPFKWAEENVLDTGFLQTTNNLNNLPLVLNVTSMSNVFDDPSLVSLAQMNILNTTGGNIASIGTSRLAFSSSNFNLFQILSKRLFDKVNNKYERIGDIFRKARAEYFADPYVLNTCLLGDPAVRLNYPENEVATTSINGNAVSSIPDTLLPGQAMQIDGEIHDPSGNLLSGFNGNVEILIYDQETTHYTLGNDTLSFPMPFKVLDDTLFFGSFPVTNGVFSSSFNLSNNIDSGFGNGKISYYANDSSSDAWGCYGNIICRNPTSRINELPGVTISVFPNPTNDRAEFTIEGMVVKDFSFTMTDARGRLVRDIKVNSNKFVIEKKQLASAVYFYELKDAKKKTLYRGRLIFN